MVNPHRKVLRFAQDDSEHPEPRTHNRAGGNSQLTTHNSQLRTGRAGRAAVLHSSLPGAAATEPERKSSCVLEDEVPMWRIAAGEGD